MQLTQLSQEYRATADRLQRRITELRMQLKTTLGEEQLATQRRIEILTAELADVRIITAYLKHYYTN